MEIFLSIHYRLGYLITLRDKIQRRRARFWQTPRRHPELKHSQLKLMPYQLTAEEKAGLAKRFPNNKISKDAGAEMIVTTAIQDMLRVRASLEKTSGLILTDRQAAIITQALCELSGTVTLNITRMQMAGIDTTELSDITTGDLETKSREITRQITKFAEQMIRRN